MLFNPNSLTVNILVTILTVVMIFGLPLCDGAICTKLGLSLSDGLSSNPNADRLLHIRKWLLIAIFGVYLLLVGYVTLFSRSAAEDYLVHVDLYHSIASSFRIDFGILEFIHVMFKEGLAAAISHIRIRNPENIAQVYMNICMFIPMGYLLPYIFDWFRRNPKRRTVTACFLASLLIENIQLITKRGFYDIDDICSNTLGGFIGVSFLMSAAYVLTHPDWKQNLKNLRLWRSEAKNYALYPFFNKVHYSRIRVFGSDSTALLDFFVKKLGMYLSRTIVKDTETCYLFEFGKNQLEVLCDAKYVNLPDQTITLTCNNSEYLKKRLTKFNIASSEYQADPYTGLRTFTISAPDHIEIVIIEDNY